MTSISPLAGSVIIENRVQRIVAEASSHRSAIPAGRQIGEMEVVGDTKYRGIGIGSILIHELTGTAQDLGDSGL